MPGVGDQHKANTTGNPFEEARLHVSEYTAQEIATLSSRLEKQLGPEYISTRPGASGQRVPYLAADKCINLANEVFGFNGWSSGIQQIQIDFVDESQSTGKVSLGLSVIVRVTLRDGTYHEDIGYGHIENCKGKAAAFEKAKKEGTTDALKRALRNFGNILGNCVYDKDYISKVTKIKIAPSRWDPDNLHRHPDYAPIKKESVIGENDITDIKAERVLEQDTMGSKTGQKYDAGEPEDEFATDDFDEADFSVNHEVNPDDISWDQSVHSTGGGRTMDRATAANFGTTPVKLSGSTHSDPTNHAHFHGNGFVGDLDHRSHKPLQAPVPQQQATCQEARPQPSRHPHALLASVPPTGFQSKSQAGSSRGLLPGQESHRQGTPPPATSTNIVDDPPVGFFTARAAESVQNSSGLPIKVPSFNPHLESPSIRKTAGVDHSKTKPVGRDIVSTPQSPAVIGPAGRPNFVNPQADKTRRVGMPAGAASPLLNRGSYKPPQMKRAVEGNVVQQPRPALGDVTSTTVNTHADSGGGDAKRQRMSGPVPQSNGHNQGPVVS
ncbi:MAG: hypothetical protein Q9170_004129 [Blastenia crenularia]